MFFRGLDAHCSTNADQALPAAPPNDFLFLFKRQGLQ
jgi:hypothetical protein